jgi:sporulation protein YhbH
MADPYSLSTDTWDLHRRAERDRARHNEKVREIIKKSLSDVIANEDIITADRNKVVKVPVRGLELPHIRFDPNDRERVGQGQGDSKPGDVIARAPSQKGPGAGKEAGQEPGQDFYEAEFTINELAEMVFEDLHLPNLADRGAKQIPSEVMDFNSVARRGLVANLDRKRTILEAMRRNAREAGQQEDDTEKPTRPKLIIREEDKRFKTWEMVTEPQRNAVIFAMRDVSGSMGEFEAYICRSFYFWMLRFLRTKYTNCEIVFITCHTEAKEVDEARFFSLGESGGTRMSSAYSLCLDIINKRYNPREWNIYPFLFSDGYNWGDQECVQLVRKLLAIVNLIGYGEIGNEGWQSSFGFAPLGQAYEDAFGSDRRVVLVKINDKDDVWPALQRFFARGPVTATTG